MSTCRWESRSARPEVFHFPSGRRTGRYTLLIVQYPAAHNAQSSPNPKFAGCPPLLHMLVTSVEQLHSLTNQMRFHRIPTYASLPEPGPPLDHDDENIIVESDFGFDRLAARLSELYLVDSGKGPKSAVISMDRYADPCRHHTVVICEPAWHRDVIEVMLEVLADLPEGWSFGIDATEFPPGQAHIMVTGSGDVYGWSEYRSRSTLDRFGFKPLKNPLSIASHYFRGWIDKMKRAIRGR